jgi:2,5-dichloro-2,5-cyclohexadiene-1,4-diol dehydrogenase 1
MNEKTVIITGGASGMGKAAAALVAKAGGRVVIADINKDGGAEVADSIVRDGGEAYFRYTDLNEEQAIQDLVQFTIEKFGKVDGAFNNGAVPPIGKRFHEVSTEEFSRTIRMNLMSVFWSMKYEITSMLTTGGGSIVNTASMAAINTVVNSSEYAAAKAAVEYARENIRVNAILPGSIRTPMLMQAFGNNDEIEQSLTERSLMGRFGEPDDIGATALFLLSDASAYINGVWLPVDGGQSAVF